MNAMKLAVEKTVGAIYPNASVHRVRRSSNLLVEIHAVREASPVQDVRKALPAASVVVKEDRYTAHGGRCVVLVIREPEWPDEPAAIGGLLTFGGAA